MTLPRKKPAVDEERRNNYNKEVLDLETDVAVTMAAEEQSVEQKPTEAAVIHTQYNDSHCTAALHLTAGARYRQKPYVEAPQSGD